MILWVGLALGSPDRPLARVGEPLKVARYAEVTGNRPRYRRSRGAIEAWTFPDGTVEHYQVHHQGSVTEIHHLDAAGRPDRSVFWEEDRVEVYGLGSVDISGWTHVEALGVGLLTPEPPDEQDDRAVLSLPEGELVLMRFKGPLDPFTDAFRDGLAETCACRPVDRGMTWLDGRPAVRFRLVQERVSAPQTVEVWALPLQDSLVVATWKTPEHLALGRALATFLATEPR